MRPLKAALAAIRHAANLDVQGMSQAEISAECDRLAFRTCGMGEGTPYRRWAMGRFHAIGRELVRRKRLGGGGDVERGR